MICFAKDGQPAGQPTGEKISGRCGIYSSPLGSCHLYMTGPTSALLRSCRSCRSYHQRCRLRPPEETQPPPPPPPLHNVIPQHLAFLLLELLSNGSRLSTLLPATPPLECSPSSSPTSSPSDALAVHSIARILDYCLGLRKLLASAIFLH
ncbi:hypothetical protein NL676_019807 [Syzygium grande]|nr:hypothetical protein NL676_019807 [Syzygium grande]